VLQDQGFSFEDHFSYPELSSDPSIDYSTGLLYNSSLWFLLYQSRDDKGLAWLKSGIELANQLVDKALASHSLLVALEVLLLRAQMYVILGEGTLSQADYTKAIELGESEDILGVFVEHGQPMAKTLMEIVKQNQLGDVKPEYTKRILVALSARHFLDEEPAPASSVEIGSETLIEPLTEREIEVLRLMTDGLKYKEIAAKLFISHNTVRFHVKSLYGKLSVNNRTQAIERARQLQIL
jgi:LuxR family maltose regulon positive regulatory protein